MKKLLPLLAFACVFAFAPTVPLTAQETGHPHGDQKDTPLGKEMKHMNHAFRTLGRQVGDASKNADSIQLVATMRQAAEASLQYKPEKTADLPAADQAKFVADFHAGIKHLIGDLDKLTAALKANDNASAAAILRQIKDDQKQGHKEFKKPHDK
jgi:soluble cytochrome b562